jgi:nicotinate-nucleotide pyrophosphorylase (carboxylating)
MRIGGRLAMAELRDDLNVRLLSAGLDPAAVTAVIQAGLAEDLADGRDVTTAATIPPGAVGLASVVTRRAGVIAGLPVSEAVFQSAGAGDGAADRVQGAAAAIVRSGLTADRSWSSGITCKQAVADGDRVSPGSVLMTVEGPLATILTAERTALNILCHLSGIATLTRQWVDAVAGTGARVRDTRKTLPGLRMLEKYAVRCGGGLNHRMSLSDAALIKDNHVAAAGSVTAALDAVGKLVPELPVEVECDTIEQVEEAVAAGAGLILLDNFSVADVVAAVQVNAGRARLEASGGLTLAAAAEIAATGVDFLAVGALTHSAPALDIGLDLVRSDR